MIEKTYSNGMIYLLSALGFFGIFSTTMAKNPVLPLYVHALGQGDAVIGLISAISPLAGILFSFPVGLMIDHLGKRRLLLLSASVFVAAPLAYIFVSNAWWLIPVRFFHGLATAILGPLSATIIFQTYPNNKGEKLGLYSSVTLVGRTVAPLLGGLILSYFALAAGLWSFRLVYIAVFLLSLPVLFLALFYREHQMASASVAARLRLVDFWQALKKIFQHGRLSSTAAVEMAIYFNFGVLETFLPVYLLTHGYGGGQIGLIFSAQILAIALTKPLFGRLADKTDKRLQIIIGMIVLGSSMAVMAVTANYLMILITSVVFGLGMSVATVSTNSYVPEIIHDKELGASMGALSSLMDVGHSSGPLIIGVIIGLYSFELGFLSALVVAALSVVIFIIFNYKATPSDLSATDSL